MSRTQNSEGRCPGRWVIGQGSRESGKIWTNFSPLKNSRHSYSPLSSAAIVSIQTAGEFLNWHPHLHVLAPAGVFRTDGGFVHSPVFDTVVLRGLFEANVLALLLKERLISPELVERMRTWRHSGFHAYAGEEIPDNEDALRVGLYIVRGPATTSRLRVDPAQKPKVQYLAKGTAPDHGEERVSSDYRDYDYLEWIARLTSHIPDRGPNSSITTAPTRTPTVESRDGARPSLRSRWGTSREVPRNPTVLGFRPAGNRGCG